MSSVIIGLVLNNETVVIVGYRARLVFEFLSENRLKKLRKDTWNLTWVRISRQNIMNSSGIYQRCFD